MKVHAFQRATLVALTLSCASLFAQEAGTKVAIINIQDAITRTQEGQKLIQDLQKQYEPKSTEIEGANQAINDLRAQLNRGANTMSEDARRDLMRQIQLSFNGGAAIAGVPIFASACDGGNNSIRGDAANPVAIIFGNI